MARFPIWRYAKYTREEKSFMIENHGKLTAAEIGAKLGRTPNAIRVWLYNKRRGVAQ